MPIRLLTYLKFFHFSIYYVGESIYAVILVELFTENSIRGRYELSNSGREIIIIKIYWLDESSLLNILSDRYNSVNERDQSIFKLVFDLLCLLLKREEILEPDGLSSCIPAIFSHFTRTDSNS